MGIEISAFNNVRQQSHGFILPKNVDLIDSVDIEDLGLDTSNSYVGVKYEHSMAFGFRRFTQFLNYLSALDREFSLSLESLFQSSEGVITHTVCVDAYFNQILPIIEDIQSFSENSYASYYPDNDSDNVAEYLETISCSEAKELHSYLGMRKSEFNNFLNLLQFSAQNEGFISYG